MNTYVRISQGLPRTRMSVHVTCPPVPVVALLRFHRKASQERVAQRVSADVPQQEHHYSSTREINSASLIQPLSPESLTPNGEKKSSNEN